MHYYCGCWLKLRLHLSNFELWHKVYKIFITLENCLISTYKLWFSTRVQIKKNYGDTPSATLTAALLHAVPINKMLDLWMRSWTIDEKMCVVSNFLQSLICISFHSYRIAKFKIHITAKSDIITNKMHSEILSTSWWVNR